MIVDGKRVLSCLTLAATCEGKSVQTIEGFAKGGVLHPVQAAFTRHHRHRGRIPGLRLGEQRSHALLAALPLFRLQPNGFANKDLRTAIADLRAIPPNQLTAGQITYDLRRLRARGLITRIPHTHRYTITDHGLHTAMFLSAVHDRFLPTGLAQLADPTSPPLRQAARDTSKHSKTSPSQQDSPPNQAHPNRPPQT